VKGKDNVWMVVNGIIHVVTHVYYVLELKNNLLSLRQPFKYNNSEQQMQRCSSRERVDYGGTNECKQNVCADNNCGR